MDTEQKSIRSAEDLCEKYSGRGLIHCISEDARAQIEREEGALAHAPIAYRYSSLNGSEKNRYRTSFLEGERRMSSGDLIRYSRDTHGAVKRSGQMTVTTKRGGIVADASQSSHKKSVLEVRQELGSRKDQLLTDWFPKDTVTYVHDTKRRRFPSKYMAALFALIISMALLVGSALLLNREERALLSMQEELGQLKKTEVSLEKELSIKNDLYSIRETAVKEYGMIDGFYVDMQFLSMTGEEQITAYSEKQEKKVGLAALLSGFLGGKN